MREGIGDLVDAVRDGGLSGVAAAVFIGGAAMVAASWWPSTSTSTSTTRSPRRVPGSQVLRLVGLATMFAALACLVTIRASVTAADAPLLEWLVNHRSPMLSAVALGVTQVGGPIGVAVLSVSIGAVLSWRARSILPALVLISTVGAATALSTVTKTVVGRSRPPVAVQVVLETDRSFPSGHVTGTTALVGMTTVLLGAGLTAVRRYVLYILAASAAIGVGATRLYLGVHWLTDVVGGLLLGASVVVAGSLVHTVLLSRNGRDPVVESRDPAPSRAETVGPA